MINPNSIKAGQSMKFKQLSKVNLGFGAQYGPWYVNKEDVVAFCRIKNTDGEDNSIGLLLRGGRPVTP